MSNQNFGATSNAEGSLEIMIHRNPQSDDGRGNFVADLKLRNEKGLAEGVKDDSHAILSHLVMLDSAIDSERYRPSAQLLFEHPLRF